MNDHLLRYAIKNVWCNPAQDKQFVYELQQLTPKYGVRGEWVVDQTRYRLPTITTQDFWHIYQIGQVIPSNLGMPRTKDTWINLNTLATGSLTLADVYTDVGINYSRAETYVMVTSQKNFLVALRINPLFQDPDAAQVYLHLYHNAYFESERSSTAGKRWIESRSLMVSSTTALRQFQIQLMDLVAAKGGYPMYFVNGRAVQEISVVTAQAGDYCDFILDPSIKKLVELPVSGLPVFTSTLDSERKYILHYDGTDDNTIDFYDDITVHLTKTGLTSTQFIGVNYHHNLGTWLRQLTHRDYSISTSRIAAMISAHPEDPRHASSPLVWPTDLWSGIADKKLKLYIREGGYKRPLVAEASRINDLYKLSSANIISLMTGTDATNPLWQAANLEKSWYVQFMSADSQVIHPINYGLPNLTSPGKVAAQNFAGNVFGYYAAGKVQADNPTKTYSDPNTGQLIADIPYSFWENATIFEYDSTGILLGHYYQANGSAYYPVNANCYMVECITGNGSDVNGGVYGNDPVTIPDSYGYRLYVSTVWGGVVKGDWKDITEADDLSTYGYLDTTGDTPIWTWTIDTTKFYGLVRIDNWFYLKELSFAQDVGVIRFAIDSWETHDGEEVDKVMEIPYGQLDIFLNNRPLIENLDYRFIDMMVVINNLEYLKLAETNTVLVRFHGPCNADLTRYPISEVGFVEYGVLSNDSIYQIHTNKVQRIIVDGHYKAYSDVVFEEDQSSATVANERNGAPFQIQTPFTVFRDVYPNDYLAKLEDDQRDQYTSDAMSEYFPKRTHAAQDVINDYYVVVSAYSNKILRDIVNGVIAPPFDANGRYTDADVVKQLASYDWLKSFDILNNDYNTNHVKVYPHWQANPIGLSSEQYDYYTRILKLNLRQTMNLAPFLYITRTV